MAPGTGLEAAAVHLPGRVEDHVQEAVHRQAEAPVDAPDRLLTLQRALGAQQEALAQVAADVGHRGQLGAGRRRRVQLRRGPGGPGPRLIRCWCCRRQTREAVAPRHGGGRGRGPTRAPRHLWLRPGPPASRRAGARPPGRALRAHRSGSSGRRRPAESPPASPAASAGRPAAPSWDRQGHSGQRRQPGAGPRPPGPQGPVLVAHVFEVSHCAARRPWATDFSVVCPSQHRGPACSPSLAAVASPALRQGSSVRSQRQGCGPSTVAEEPAGKLALILHLPGVGARPAQAPCRRCSRRGDTAGQRRLTSYALGAMTTERAPGRRHRARRPGGAARTAPCGCPGPGRELCAHGQAWAGVWARRGWAWTWWVGEGRH